MIQDSAHGSEDSCIINVEWAGRSGLWGLVATLLGGQTREQASLFAKEVRITCGTNTAAIRLCDIDEVRMRRFLTSAEVHIRHAQDVTKLGRMKTNDAIAFERELKNARERWWNDLHLEPNAALDRIGRALDRLDAPARFVRKKHIRDLTQDIESCIGSFGGSWPAEAANAPGVRQLVRMEKFLKDSDGERRRSNQAYFANELAHCRGLFDGVESHPLTDEQRRAVVTDEARNLVVASAGSGKTSVIVAKAAWLVSSKRRLPGELLLLAFARDASVEMEDRLRSRLGAEIGDEIAVRTFHGLGMSIIGEAEGTRPSLAKSAEDARALQSSINEIVQELLNSDEELSRRIRGWFRDHFAPFRSEHDFGNMGEYWDYIRRHDLRSLNGDKVKSFEECEISNFLYLNGVPHEYEADYEYETATAEKRGYKPDFHISGTSIYIEHFGIDAHGNTAPHVDREAYLKDREWKKKTHADHGTVLIETFSHERSSGSLLRKLERNLVANGVKLSPISNEMMFEALRRNGGFNRFTVLIATFLSHFKGSGMSMSELEQLVSGRDDRAKAFLEVFRPVLESYQSMLSHRGELDFNDMISRAARLVETGRYGSPYKYILVDEFQDISASRARLLRALLKNAPDAQLFAVGDDWQSIYRFGGSDISIMKGFENLFGDCERTDLETTFRCSEGIVRVATEWVLRNPAQLRKTVHAKRCSDGPAVWVGHSGNGGRSPLLEAISMVSEDAARHGGTSDVLILGRYRHLRPDGMGHWQRKHPDLRFNYMTVHGSKGLEADYVIVVGLCTGEYGFPSEITDDPLYDLVLADPESYPNAEERRLLYVAITRAKRKVFLLAEGSNPSTFAEELSAATSGVGSFGRKLEEDARCPECGRGRLQRKQGTRDRVFYGCSNWSRFGCSYTVNACSNCNEGLPVRGSSQHNCRECGSVFRNCPECYGFLRKRMGRYGRFLGCSNYPACSFTENV